MLSRRGFLGVGALSVFALSGCVPTSVSPRDPAANCVAAGALSTLGQVNDVPLAYEETGREQAFRFEPDFHAQLSRWFGDWQQRSGLDATRVRTYGAWIDGGADCGSSWHHAGRAFDISGVDGPEGVLVSCRTDLWDQLSAVERAVQERRYWALAASLHLHFAYVLTHLYDSAHANHIHVDNGVSGADMSRFTPRSRVQNQAVQAIAQHLWDEPCEITGRWDRQTERATEAILQRVGASGSLTRGDNWRHYLTESIGRAS